MTPPDGVKITEVSSKVQGPVGEMPLTFSSRTAKKLMVSNNAERQRLERMSKQFEKKCEMEVHQLENAQKDFLKTSLVMKEKISKHPELMRRKSMRHNERPLDAKSKNGDDSETNLTPAFVPLGTLAPLYKQSHGRLKDKNRDQWMRRESKVPEEIESLKECRYLRANFSDKDKFKGATK